MSIMIDDIPLKHRGDAQREHSILERVFGLSS
jgi:hypothetical protein